MAAFSPSLALPRGPRGPRAAGRFALTRGWRGLSLPVTGGAQDAGCRQHAATASLMARCDIARVRRRRRRLPRPPRGARPCGRGRRPTTRVGRRALAEHAITLPSPWHPPPSASPRRPTGPTFATATPPRRSSTPAAAPSTSAVAVRRQRAPPHAPGPEPRASDLPPPALCD
jgi:hypothetical protein